MDWIKFLGLFAGFCTTIAVTPQLYKTWKEKSVEDISIGMFSILTPGLMLWTVYGIIKTDIPIILTNGISTTFNLIMIFFFLGLR
ncbi:MAG: SemiSWEET transporter [Acidobacteriota bacterium]|jgi:MtN3 and saliva related transmembrane protein|nr:SemiSWEET transporter [Acidobacteriota bacterium]